MTFKCEHKTIWLTGGSSGIGKALLDQLIKKNNFIYITARSKTTLETLESTYPKQVKALVGDITDKTTLKQHAEYIFKHHQLLDILILNAGTAEYIDIKAFDSELMKRIMDINFIGSMYILEFALPLLRAGTTKTIVGIGSSATYTPFSRAEAYGASKAAFHYCLNALRVDLSPEGFHVCLVAPGFVKTPLTDRNDFPMPMRIDPVQAAAKILKGVSAQKQQIRFPIVFTTFIALLGVLPSKIRNRMMQTLIKKDLQ